MLYLLACFRAWQAYILTCLRALRARVVTWSRCYVLDVLGILTCLRFYLITYFICISLIAKILAWQLKSNLHLYKWMLTEIVKIKYSMKIF